MSAANADHPGISSAMRLWLTRWRVCTVLVLSILGLGLPTVATASAAGIIYPASGVVGLDPPDGMAEASDFAGFVSDDGASIVIIEMPPEAFDDIAAKFNADGLAAQMKVTGAPQQLTLSGDVQALLVKGKQTAQGIAFRKWALLARGPMTTALVTVQIPDSDTRYSEADILAALKSLRIRTGQSIEAQIDALPFTIADLAGFRPVRTLAGSSLLLTDGPASSYQDGSQPIVIVAASMGSSQHFSEMSKEDREGFARRLVNQLGYADLAVEKVHGNEDDGVTLTGTAIDPKHKQQVVLRQVLRFDETGYTRTVCVAKPEQATEQSPEQTIVARCDRIARSMTLKDGGDAARNP